MRQFTCIQKGKGLETNMNNHFGQMLTRLFHGSSLVLPAFLVTVSAGLAQDLPPVLTDVTHIAVPAGGQAQEPSLAADSSSLVMSWLDTERATTKVQFARLTEDAWSQPVTVAEGDDLFVNWADFPGITTFDNTGVAVHWLRKSGRSGFDYNVEIAMSKDGGKTWAEPIVPHSDRSQVQHGFVALTAAPDQTLDVLWLDGRAYGRVGFTEEPDAMQLRATRINLDASRSKDVAVDLQTCSCCQTSAARLNDGTLVVAYRDRSDAEVRDVAIVRHANGAWSKPAIVHHDGWEIAGCPVNGPAVATHEQTVTVVWFTGAEDVAAVKLAVSTDGGATFGQPQRIDTGAPLGRVDAAMLADGTVLVTWLEWDGDDEVLQICRATAAQGCVSRQTLARNAEAGSMNFPRMAVLNTEVFIAWTQPTSQSESTIALLRGTVAKADPN